MIAIDSTNRSAAKRLLNNWHDSRRVRTMTLAELTQGLQVAVNNGLITVEGIERALRAASARPQHGGTDKGTGNGEQNDGDREPEEREGENGEGKGGEGKGDDSNDAPPPKGEQKSDEGKGDPSEEKDNGEPEESESDGDDSESEEKESDSEKESDDEKKSDDESEEEENEDQQEEEEEDNDEEQQHDMFKTVLKYISAGLNVALVGPAGTGKSYMARQIAAKLEKPFYVNGALMSKYDLTGYCDANGTYHDTPAYKAFVTGGVHCFDELDGSAPDAVVAFNGMTDDQPFFTFPNGQQDQHPDYVAIACMNTWGNGASAAYVGRYKQDAASMSRFVKVFIDYDPRVEAKLGNADIVQRVQAVREACKTLGIQHIVSSRMIIQADKARKAKATKTEIDRDIIFAGLDEGAIAQIKSQIKVKVQS